MKNGESSYSRFLSGDKYALDELIRDYKDGLIFYLYSIVGDIHKAEDFAIDTFIKLYTDRPAFRGKSAFKTWLYTIGRNIACDAVRKQKLTEVPLESAPQLAEAASLEKEYIKDEDRITLRRNIQKLKPEYRQVLYLIYIEGFDHSETADIMKKSGKQVRDLLYRAKNALKKELEKEGFVYEEL